MDLIQLLAWFSPAALAFALWAYFHPRKRLKLEYQTASTRYFEKDSDPLPPEAVMTFRGEEVERLARATVIVWNGGTEVLKREDIVPDDPIRVCVDENASVLIHAVAGTTNETNRVAMKAREGRSNELELTYEYLNPDDGCVLHIIHDGKQQRPLLIGTVRGLSDGPRSRGDVDLGEHRVDRVLRKITWFIAASCGVGILSLFGPIFGFPSILDPLLNDTPPGPVKRSIGIALLVTLLLITFIGSVRALFTTRPMYPRSLMSHIRTENSV